MKKRLIIIAIIVSIVLFPTIRATLDKIMIPDRVLLVGHQIDDKKSGSPIVLCPKRDCHMIIKR
ncbi:hypothetical protein [Alkaliphilus metalliredigens]|uniref:hypothetical protein n=1 Tax=Alkaliphilus metalliredigens TaxID=208226 RepID=UPI0005A260D1|nr:hypothetical protein [Alkaliphilus metalliredigens]